MVVISNGFNKFHLSVAAEELDKRLLLTLLITGAYPTIMTCRIAEKWPINRLKKSQRLLARAQHIPDNLIVPFHFTEGLHALGLGLKNSHSLHFIRNLFNLTSLRVYGEFATRHIRKAAKNGALIYHYRAGFGQNSVRTAKDYGMVTICDFSIAHGAILEYMIVNKGQFPPPGKSIPINRFWSLVLRDADQADYVLVNSDFVKDTFIHQGWDEQRVRVIYWGVDDQFLKQLEGAPIYNPSNCEPLSILFAGAFEKRKGIDTIVSAFKSLSGFDWRLTIAGAITRDTHSKYRSFLQDSRIAYKGILPRMELAKIMRKTDVFIFPSLAEGSARVIFEALAAGCYVITTPNSGSIVKNGENGCLMPPGNEASLRNALQRAHKNRSDIRRIGEKNAELIRTQYRQKHYGDQLVHLYNQILN